MAMVKGMLLFEFGNWIISKPNIKTFYSQNAHLYFTDANYVLSFEPFFTVFFGKIIKILIDNTQPYFDL